MTAPATRTASADRRAALVNVLRVAGQLQARSGCSAADAINRSTEDKAMRHLAVRAWSAATNCPMDARRFDAASERIAKMNAAAWMAEAARWASYVKRLIRIEEQRHEGALEMYREWLRAAGCK